MCCLQAQCYIRLVKPNTKYCESSIIGLSCRSNSTRNALENCCRNSRSRLRQQHNIIVCPQHQNEETYAGNRMRYPHMIEKGVVLCVVSATRVSNSGWMRTGSYNTSDTMMTSADNSSSLLTPFRASNLQQYITA